MVIPLCLTGYCRHIPTYTYYSQTKLHVAAPMNQVRWVSNRLWKRHFIDICLAISKTTPRLEQHFIEDSWVVARCRAACLCTRVVCGEAFHRDGGEVIS